MEENKSQQITIKNVSLMSGPLMEENVDRMVRHMKFFNYFYIVYGAISCLTIFGAIIGVPMIIYHLKLNESAQSYREFVNSNDFFFLNKAFENQRKFFFFYKILIGISLAILVLVIVFMIVVAAMGIMNLPSDFA